MKRNKKFLSANLALLFALLLALGNPVCADEFSQSTNVFYEDDLSDFINEYSVSIPATFDLRNDASLDITLDNTSILTTGYNVSVDLDESNFSGNDANYFYLYDENHSGYYRAYEVSIVGSSQVLHGGDFAYYNITTFDSSQIGQSVSLNFTESAENSNPSPAPTKYSSSLTFNIHGDYGF